MKQLWSDLDDDVLFSLGQGALTPAEIGQRLGMSERAAGSILAMLAQEGHVRIRSVELVAITKPSPVTIG